MNLVTRLGFGVLTCVMWSCAHYFPVQMGEGEFADREVVSCSHQVFGFPTERNATRVDVSLMNNGLSSSDVYSIEHRLWPYLFPVYSNHCLVLSLNTSGAKKVAYADPVLTAATETDKARKKKVEDLREEQERGKIEAKAESELEKEFPGVRTMKDCDQFLSLEKGRCRRAVYKTYKNK